MDARQQLRRYLEQRRELGERELVLDGMTVEEVLRIVGAGAARTNGGRDHAPRPPVLPAESAVPERAPVAAPADPPPAAPPRQEFGDSADWRAVLRSTGSAPGAERREDDRPRAAANGGVSGTDDPPPAGGGHEPERRPAAGRVELAGVPTGIVVGDASRELFAGAQAEYGSLDEIARAVASCTRCPLHRTALNPVPGEGNPQAQLVCVGEAPGATEDEMGRPFVGPAGELLTKILAAIQLRREDVYICNVLKHRPPGNRNPAPSEVEACSPYLLRQLELLRPKVILALGTFAAQTLLDTKLSIGKLRGAVHRYHGIPLIVTYHPAALLRNEAWKRPTWEDVKLARRILDLASGA